MMAKKIVKCLVIVVLVFFAVYNSVYFKKLSDVKAAMAKDFDAPKYARNYFTAKLMPAAAKAPDIDALLATLKSDPKTAFKNDSHALDIGNIRFFMTQGQGTVLTIDDNDVTLLTKNKQTVKIAIQYVFGNALRDAPGIINVNDFTNLMDLNGISTEVDKIIRESVVPPFKSKVKKGDSVMFAGAFELNQEHLNLDNVEIMPVTLKITQ